jgi:hypothetical protein
MGRETQSCPPALIKNGGAAHHPTPPKILSTAVPLGIITLFEKERKMEIKEIQEAVARGWTYPANAKKVMDTDLAEAISIEVLKLYATEAAQDVVLKMKAQGIEPDYEQAMADQK